MRIAVIGAGVMGTNHARVAGTLPDVELTHVVDADAERAAAAASAHGAIAATDPLSVIGQVDAAIVALPTLLHAEVAVPLLEQGIHCLVEKPIAGSVADGERIIAAAASGGAVLAVGHVERFNPAMIEAEKFVDGPIHIETARVGPFSSRVADSVVTDLMIHDLDLVRSLAAGELASVAAIAQRVRTDTEDLATALVRFDSDVSASLTASRLGQQKSRTIGITKKDSYLYVDMMRQEVTIQRLEHVEYTGSEGTVYRQRGVVEIPMIETRGEPLWLEQREFLDAAREGRAPKVSGRDGLEALRMALAVVDACRPETA